ncbi:SHOCT domain-containing protein [Nocardioides pakistanensis]
MRIDDLGPMGPGNERRWRDDGWWDMHDGMGTGLGWGGWLLVVLLVLLLLMLIAGIIALIAWSTRRPHPSTQPAAPATPEVQSPALQMLDERFAYGDIDEEEYLRRRALLRGG